MLIQTPIFGAAVVYGLNTQRLLGIMKHALASCPHHHIQGWIHLKHTSGSEGTLDLLLGR